MIRKRGDAFQPKLSTQQIGAYANLARVPGYNPNGWVYRHARWKELRAQVIAIYGERCCDPHHDNTQPVTRIDLDHIKEVSDGGKPFDIGNVMLRCRRCHSIKTKYAQRRRFVLDSLR